MHFFFWMYSLALRMGKQTSNSQHSAEFLFLLKRFLRQNFLGVLFSPVMQVLHTLSAPGTEISDFQTCFSFSGILFKPLHQVLYLFCVKAVFSSCTCGTGGLALKQGAACRHIKIAFGKMHCEHQAKANLCSSSEKSRY